MLLGCTEFTKVYLQIKDNPWPYVNLVKLTQNSRMRDGEVVELLKIANGYLPRIRLEYDRLKEEKSSLEAELNSWKVEISNVVRIYQQFCDRNLELKKREDELQLALMNWRLKRLNYRRLPLDSNSTLAELQETNANLEIKQEIMSTNDLFIPSPNMVIVIIRMKMKYFIILPKLSHHLGH